jgi:fibronectin type 3 domain-containing protein
MRERTMTRKLGLAAALLWVSLGFWSCGKKPMAPVLPKENQFPPAPRNLAVTVDDRQTTLTWDIDNAAAVKFYRIYRRDTTTAVFAAIDTSLDRIHVDRNVRSDTKYFYQVTAVNAGGFESKRSEIVAATPNSLASIIIAAGADYIAQRQVTLKLTAPPRTALMRLSNDVLFTNASWQRFESTVSWVLSFGDGAKTVHVKFRDADGKENPQVVTDSIILDTTALITEVTEDTQGQIKAAGDVIHFRLKANEPGGRATLNIFSGPQNILLFDDGTQGDKAAGNGIYELDYTIPQDVQVLQAKVRGNFVDRVDNVAATVAAATQITIQKPPDAVKLFAPVPAGSQQNALRLTWSASKDTFDFANYSIYRSQTPMPNFNPLSLTPIDRVTNREVASYTDQNLQAGTMYYYRVVVFDLAGYNASSNEVSAQTPANQPPSAVILNKPLLVGDGTSQVQLSWSRSSDNDFASYRLYRSSTAPVNLNSLLVTSLTNQSTTEYIDNNLKAVTKYVYRIYVYDQAGNATGSNIDSVMTAPNQNPTPVILALPAPVDTAALSLSWSQNNDADFASYHIFRAKAGDPPIDPKKGQSPITILNGKPDNTTYIDRGLLRRTTYTYQVFVYDTGGLYSGSNPVQGTTR